MDNHKNLRAAVTGTLSRVQVERLDLAELLQEYDCLRAAAATVKRGKREYPADFSEAYDATKNAGIKWGDGSTPAAAHAAWVKSMKRGATPEEMIAGAHRYSAFCKAHPDRPVLMAQTFFGPQERYTAEYALPRSDIVRRTGPMERRDKPTIEQRRQEANAEAARILDGQPMFNDDGMTIDAT